MNKHPAAGAPVGRRRRRNVSALRDLPSIRREAARLAREAIRGDRPALEALLLTQTLGEVAALHGAEGSAP